VKRDDLTRKKFIADFLDIPNNPSKRIYRTGDLGRINGTTRSNTSAASIRRSRFAATGRAGRNRIRAVGIAADRAGGRHHLRTRAGMVELVAYYSLKQGASDLPRSEITRALRKPAAGQHGSRLYRTASFHPDVDQQQGGSQEAAEAETAAFPDRKQTGCREKPRRSASWRRRSPRC